MRSTAADPDPRAELAASLGRESAPFEIGVRTLKNRGREHSLSGGSELSPRGRAFLERPRGEWA